MLQSLAGSSCVRVVERHRSAWCFGLLVLGYLLYLVFGAVVFSSVELPYEDLLRQELRKLKRSFVEEHKCLSEAQLESFLARVLEASNYGVSVLSNASANWNWDFTSSLFFASTVLSTTGKEPARAQASPTHPSLAAFSLGPCGARLKALAPAPLPGISLVPDAECLTLISTSRPMELRLGIRASRTEAGRAWLPLRLSLAIAHSRKYSPFSVSKTPLFLPTHPPPLVISAASV